MIRTENIILFYYRFPGLFYVRSTHRNGCEATAFVASFRCQRGAKRVVVLYPMSPRSRSPRRWIHLFASIFFAAKQLRRKVRCRWWSVMTYYDNLWRGSKNMHHEKVGARVVPRGLNAGTSFCTHAVARWRGLHSNDGVFTAYVILQ